MRETLYNQRFEDIYFSPEDGLAETRHVFLDGNGLPQRWQGRADFTIAETGFGTGLNFLAAWQLFEETSGPGQTLDYVSFELYPLERDVIEKALLPWRGELGGRLERMLALYPLRIAGFHRLWLNERVSLTLVFDDVNNALPELVALRGVDAWFLDGFAPAKNPQMWTEVLFSEMARLSNEGTTAATFTAAGAVRRGLEAAGFSVEKKRGYGRKRDMTVARFHGKERPFGKSRPQKVAIIGGGLAGTSCAYVLGKQGYAVTLFEKGRSLASGASGNAMGLYNPRFTAQRGAESDFYAGAFALAVRTLEEITQQHDIAFHKCGALHLVNSPEKEKRFRMLCGNWGWHEDHLRYLAPQEVSAQAGIVLDQDALFLPDSGQVSPRALCEAYAADADVRFEAAENIDRQFDAVIVANGVAAKDFPALSWLPLHTVRGQISAAAASAQSEKLACNICYGGYIGAPCHGMHMVGSTFQKWLSDTDVKDEDHRDNLEKLAAAVPALGQLQVTGGRAALRTTSPDHFPVIGAAGDNLYVSTAHGSHGILSTLAGAHLIADMMAERPYSLPRRSAAQLDGARFLKGKNQR